MATIGQPLPASSTSVLGGATPTPIQQAAANATLSLGNNGLGVLEQYTAQNQLNQFRNGLPTVPAVSTPATTTPVATPTSTPTKSVSSAPSTPSTPVSTKSIYRIGNDVYDAETNKKIPDVATLVKDYSGAKEVVAPSKPAVETTPTTNPVTETKTTSNGAEGYDAALKAEADAKVSKVDTLLQRGYSDPALIASASGMTVDEVNNYLNSNEDASYKLSVNKNANQQDQAYNTYKSAMDQITNGTFALTATEQANINAIQAQFDKMKQDQINANANYEGATQTAEIRSGRQEFMNQISGGIYKQAVDDGLNKVKQIESDAVAKITEYKQAIQDKNYKAADAAYTATQKYLADKSTAIKELHDATMDEYKRQQDAIKAANDQITTDLQNQKLKQDIAKTTVEGLTPALSGATPEIIDAVAKYYNIDANLLQGSIQSATQKFDQSMIGKGYRIINPADVEKMRALGADVQEYQGRAYMKEPELQSVTNKGNIDFFKGTRKVGTSTLTGGGSIEGASTDQKEIDAFNADIKDARQKVAAGTWTNEDARNYVQSQYGLTPENAAIAFPEYGE